MLNLALTEKDSQPPEPALWQVDVAVQTPAHAALDELLSYTSAHPVAAGTLAVVGANYRLLEGRAVPDVMLGQI